MTSHDKGPRTRLDSRILRGYCGVKELGHPSPLYTKPKAHAEEGEMPEDEQRKSKLVFIPPIKVTVRVFPSIKLRKYPPLDHHRIVERREHRVARI